MVTPHEMTADAAVGLLTALRDSGCDACVGGGWGVDALLGRQTRPHEDLDLWVPVDQTAALFRVLAARGVDRLVPWPDNRPWNFPVEGGRLRVDLHFHEPADDDRLHYGAHSGGHLFPRAALDGRGTIAGVGVRCESPEWSLQWHTGYPPRSKDRHDVPLLCDRFALPLPDGFA